MGHFFNFVAHVQTLLSFTLYIEKKGINLTLLLSCVTGFCCLFVVFFLLQIFIFLYMSSVIFMWQRDFVGSKYLVFGMIQVP